MVNKDLKNENIVEKYEDKNMTDEQRSKLFLLVKKGWDAFHKYVVYALITCLIGVYVGITASKIYYKNKMEEAILLQGMVFEKKPYTIIPK